MSVKSVFLERIVFLLLPVLGVRKMAGVMSTGGNTLNKQNNFKSVFHQDLGI